MIRSVSIVGLNSDQASAQATSFYHKLFVVLQCLGEDAFSTARQAISEAEEVFNSSSGTPSEIVGKIQSALINHLAKTGQESQTLVGLIQEDDEDIVCYLLSTGIKALLFRDKEQIELVSIDNAELVSGFLQTRDRLVFINSSLASLLGDNLKKLCLSRSLEQIEDEVTANFVDADANLPMAALVVEVADAEQHPQPTSLNKSSKTIQKLRSFYPKILAKIKDNSLWFGLGLLILTVVGTGLIFYQKKNTHQSAQFNAYLSTAQEQLNLAKSLKDLNPASAKESFKKSKQAISDVLKIKPKNITALNLEKEILDSAKDVLKIYQLGDIPIWLELDLIKKGFFSSSMSVSSGNIILLDLNQKSLVELNLAKKSPQILAGSDKIGQARFASLNGEKAFVFSLDLGIIDINTRSLEAKTVTKADPEWGEIGDLYGFSGNVYLLDKTKKGLYKYLPTASGYSDKRSYFKFQPQLDFDSVLKLQIDGSIWLLTKGGKIFKFTQGVEDSFNIKGLDKELSSPKSFFVSSETDSLYLLDNGNNRLLVFDKQGTVKAQYRSKSFFGFTDLVVAEEEKRAYFLDGTKIYMMELK